MGDPVVAWCGVCAASLPAGAATCPRCGAAVLRGRREPLAVLEGARRAPTASVVVGLVIDVLLVLVALAPAVVGAVGTAPAGRALVALGAVLAVAVVVVLLVVLGRTGRTPGLAALGLRLVDGASGMAPGRGTGIATWARDGVVLDVRGGVDTARRATAGTREAIGRLRPAPAAGGAVGARDAATGATTAAAARGAGASSSPATADARYGAPAADDARYGTAAGYGVAPRTGDAWSGAPAAPGAAPATTSGPAGTGAANPWASTAGAVSADSGEAGGQAAPAAGGRRAARLAAASASSTEPSGARGEQASSPTPRVALPPSGAFPTVSTGTPGRGAPTAGGAAAGVVLPPVRPLDDAGHTGSAPGWTPTRASEAAAGAPHGAPGQGGGSAGPSGSTAPLSGAVPVVGPGGATARPTGGAHGIVLVADDGERLLVTGLTLIGRNPEPRPGEVVAGLVPMIDMTRSVSKTHASVRWDGTTLWVADRGSTNGTAVVRPGAQPLRVGTATEEEAPVGSQLRLGERVFRVEATA